MGSNGLTSARHDVFYKKYAQKYPESFDNAVPSDLVYAGHYGLTDKVEGVLVDAGKLVLAPTRTYAPIVIKALQELRGVIHGMVHCSGGAQTKVLHFVDKLHIIKNNLLPIPPLFKMIQSQSKTDWKEIYKVFNMGHRLEFYLPEKYAQQVIDISTSFGVEAQIIGRVEAGEKSKVSLTSEYGSFEYQ